MSKKTVILISREYGSGGREMGEKLAKALNIPFYDREIILASCKESGYDMSLFEKVDEQNKHPISYFLSMYSSSMSPYDLSLNDQIFLIQSKVILQMAQQSCVIIGRCADYILRDDPDILKIFVQGEINDRCQRAIEEYHDEAKDIIEKIKRIDKNRATYYNYYTNEKWGRLKNYDLSFNTSIIDINTCVEMIKQYVQTRNI